MDQPSDVDPASPAAAGGAGVRPDSASPAAACGLADQVIRDWPAVPTDLVIRDDRAPFPVLRDMAKARRGTAAPLKVIDTGALPVPELEWLGRAGAEIYSSDVAKRSVRELVLVATAAGRGGARIAHFHHGPFADGEDAALLPFDDLLELGRSGVDLYVSDAKGPRDFAALDALAYACEKGGATFAYYHNGPLAPGLEDLARRGAWIHISGRRLGGDEDARLVADCAHAARATGAGLMLHADTALDPQLAADLMEAGVHIVFLTPPSDYRSPLRPLEERARRLPPTPRASYLFSAFML
jgi:hypothetical protein